MEALIQDWLSMLLRWLHIIAGISWIGTSFYFMWLDASLRKREGQAAGVLGESWSVHGGGFYQVQKFGVAPERMPDELHWFKWESYMTWLSGFCLLVVIYYWSASSYLIDRSVADISPWLAVAVSAGSMALAWFVYDQMCKSQLRKNQVVLFVLLFCLIVLATFLFGKIFAPRAAFLHAGIIIATVMTGNVFLVIIRNQKVVVKDLMEGRAPNPEFGKIAKLRSTHNNYFTLPVIFIMISNHYPMVFGHEYNWVIVGFVLAIGAVIRIYYNLSFTGVTGTAVAWQWPTAGVLMLALVAFTAWRPGAEGLADGSDPVTAADAMAIVQTHCATCHAAAPTHEFFPEAPGGVMFDTEADFLRHGAQILAQAVHTQAMPLGNETGMTPEDRARLGAWISREME